MTINRRRFVRLSLEAGLVTPAIVSLDGPISAAHAVDADTLRAYVDTLIPADQSPSATQLSVAEKMLARTKEDLRYRTLLEYGCSWLDREAGNVAGARFADVTEPDRERIVARAAGAPPGSPIRVFFDTTRDHAFIHYYATPESWRTIGYSGPPQPVGFPDYARPPRHRHGR
jgi:hypothetical protein